MKLLILFGQREERYEWEYAPEALAVVDEFTSDENPQWLADQLAKHREDGSFAAVRVLAVEVDGDEIRSLLLDTPTLRARLLDGEGEG